MTKLAGRSILALKVVIWVCALIPAVVLLWKGLRGELGANPIEEITHRTGWWTLFLLTATLAITPLRRLTGWHKVIRVRRLVGLFAFFYGTLHFLTYLVLDQFFAFGYILEDIAERPFITVGFTAWMILLALALTSTTGSIRRLGRKWRKLHRLVYVAAGLGGLHFLWRVKADTREPLVFLGVLIALLAFRLPYRRLHFGSQRRVRGLHRRNRQNREAMRVRGSQRSLHHSLSCVNLKSEGGLPAKHVNKHVHP